MPCAAFASFSFCCWCCYFALAALYELAYLLDIQSKAKRFHRILSCSLHVYPAGSVAMWANRWTSRTLTDTTRSRSVHGPRSRVVFELRLNFRPHLPGGSDVNDEMPRINMHVQRHHLGI